MNFKKLIRLAGIALICLMATIVSINIETRADGYTGLADQPAADGNWYYYVDGYIAWDVTTVACNQYGWWYVENGKVNFQADTISPNEYGWWVIRGGAVDFNYTGIASNEYGDWYCIGGRIQFDTYDILPLDNKGVSGWWLVQNGQIMYCDTVAANEYGWWAIVNGMVDFSAQGIYSNQYGCWYVSGGQVDFNVNGLELIGSDWLYLTGGCVDFGYEGLVTNDFGTWYVYEGKVRFDYTGIVYGEVNGTWGWWYVYNGAVTYKDTVDENEYGWWYVHNGMVDFSYTGLAGNINGLWYINGGQVDFSYNGICRCDGFIFDITNGRARLIRSEQTSSNNRIWVGDSRTCCIESVVGDNENDMFICRKETRYDYFENEALPQLIEALNTGYYDSVVILMGVNDIIDHPTDYGNVAWEYINTINNLIEQYPHVKFYIASVYYIDDTFVGEISPTLNASIATYNSIMYNYCWAQYIPLAEYVDSNNLRSQDGLHIDGINAVYIYNYICSSTASRRW